MKIRVIIFSFLALLATPAAMAQGSATATTTVEVNAGLSVSLLAGTELNFGKLSTSAAAGTCVVSTDGVATVTGGVGLGGGTPSVVSFTLSGKALGVYEVSTPASVTIARIGGSETLSVDNFQVRVVGASTNDPVGTLSASGDGEFKVGGTISLSANQAEGVYSGTFSVSVAYQ